MATAQILTWPGVYLNETAPVVHQVTPATTNVTAFLGVFPRGPVSEAVYVSSWSEYEAQFGGLTKTSTLAAYAVWQFFLNGGIGAWIVRLAATPAAASATIGPLKLTANVPGSGMQDCAIDLAAPSNSTTTLTITPKGGTATTFQNLDASSVEKLADAITNHKDTNGHPDSPVTATAVGDTVPSTETTGSLAGGFDGDETATQAMGPLTLTADSPGAAGNQLAAALAPSGGNANPSPTYVDYTLTMATAQGPQVIENIANLDPTDLSTLAAMITNKSSYISAAGTSSTVATTPASVSFGGGTATAPASVTLGDVKLVALTPGTDPNAWTASVTSDGDQLDLTISVTVNNQTTTVEALKALPQDSFAFARAVSAASKKVGIATSFSGGADGQWSLNRFQDAVIEELGSQTPRLDLIAPRVFNLMCIPDAVWFDPSSSDIFTTAHGFCQARQAFLLVDPPPPAAVSKVPAVLDDAAPPVTIQHVGRFENLQYLFSAWAKYVLGINNIAGATYYPWVQIPDPANNYLPRFVPPSGTMAGVYARTDESRGVWKSPAGVMASLVGVTGLADNTINKAVNGELSPRGINCLRTFPTYQSVSWGARTLAGDDLFDSPFKYVSVRRLADFIEQSLMQSLNWTVFEPNSSDLWAAIVAEIKPFMTGLHASGAFVPPGFVAACDATTTSPTDMLNGVVNVQVGFQPVEPAEFVLLNVQVGGLATAATS
jgi:hypothetical protein